MVRFEGLVGKFIIATLVFLSLFTFIITLQSDNDSAERIRDNEVFNESFEELLGTIDESTSAAEEKYDVFNTEEPKAGFGSIVLFGIVSVGKTFSASIFGFFASIIKLPLIILGVPENVYNLVSTILVIVAIVSLWLLYKLGG